MEEAVSKEIYGDYFAGGSVSDDCCGSGGGDCDAVVGYLGYYYECHGDSV
jgi:hypothetical protein